MERGVCGVHRSRTLPFWSFTRRGGGICLYDVGCSEVGRRTNRLPTFRVTSTVGDALGRSTGLIIATPPKTKGSAILPLALLKTAPRKGVLVLRPHHLTTHRVTRQVTDVLNRPIKGAINCQMHFRGGISSRAHVRILARKVLAQVLVRSTAVRKIDTIVFSRFRRQDVGSSLTLTLAQRTRRVVQPSLGVVVVSTAVSTSTVYRTLRTPLVRDRKQVFPMRAVCSRASVTQCSVCGRITTAVLGTTNECRKSVLTFLPKRSRVLGYGRVLSTDLDETTTRLSIPRICPLCNGLPPRGRHLTVTPSHRKREGVILTAPVTRASLAVRNIEVIISSKLYQGLICSTQAKLDRLRAIAVDGSVTARQEKQTKQITRKVYCQL